MPLYKPPVANQTKQIPLLALIGQVDPDHNQRKFRELEYFVGGRTPPRYVNPTRRGAYNDYSNIYSVGQPFGGLDTAKVAAKAPTVGNSVPGLYEGVPDGLGWA